MKIVAFLHVVTPSNFDKLAHELHYHWQEGNKNN